MSGRKIDWSVYDALLGEISDYSLAKRIGCHAGTVVRRRQKLRIPPVFERTAWSPEDAKLFTLGRIKCRKCRREKEISAFIKNKMAKHGYRQECRDCHQILIKERRRKIKKHWIDQMGGNCQWCGFDKWIAPLQFHHVDWEWANKNQDNTYPNLVMYRKYDESQIRLELDKCCLLCANCHDAIHSGEISPAFVKRETFGWTIKNPREDGSPPK